MTSLAKNIGKRICLIGTSNSIYRDGYAGAVEDDDRVISLTRYSMGASPSIIIPYFGSDINFKDFDTVIFETAINDRNYYKHGSIRKEQIRSFIEWGIQKATGSGCNVALLVMPSRKGMLGPTISGMIYQKIASETGAVFLDGYDFTKTFSLATETQINDLFIDDFHLKKPIARKLGRVLLDKILAPKRVRTSFISHGDKYYKIGAESISAVNVVRRSNSLMSEAFIELNGKHDQMLVRITPGHEIVGIVYNASKTSGKLRISSSKNTCVKLVTTKYFGSPKDMLLIACPLIEGVVAGEDGLVRLAAADPGETATETSRFERHAEQISDSGQFEIACLIAKARKS